MKRIFLLEAIDLAVMGRGQAITLPIDSGEILLSLDRQAFAGEGEPTPPALKPGPTEKISPTEAGRRLGLQSRTILKRIERGTLRARRHGGQWRISPADLTTESMPLRQRRRITIRKAPKRKDFFAHSLTRPQPNEITAKEAAKKLGLSPSAIVHKARAGVLQGRQIGGSGSTGGRWVFPRTISLGKEGTDFKLTKHGHRMPLGSFPCPRCRTIWPTQQSRSTHIRRVHTKTLRVPGQGR